MVPALRELALPPIHRGILECRLAANATQVDLAQCILTDVGESSLLAEWMANATSASDRLAHPAWDRLRNFCVRWADPSSLFHAGMRNVWLEFDLDEIAPALPPPAFFLGLKREIQTGEAYMVTEKGLRLLLDKAELTSLKSNLRHCFEACPDVALVNQVGVMLSRQTNALRVCIQGLTPDQIIPYLRQVGWPGPVDELEHLVRELTSSAGHISMVDIDVGATVEPKVGLEVGFGGVPEQEAHWVVFLDDLVERRLCTSKKKDALLKWPGVTNPPNSSAPWPAHLIVESLFQSTGWFSGFDRRLNHVKIVYQPEKLLEAKAYLRFEHVWGQPQLANKDHS